MNKVHWAIAENELTPCKHTDKIVPLISEEGLKTFRNRVNEIIFTTLETSSPFHLRFGGQALALIIIILGVVCMTQDEVVTGAVLALLGVIFAAIGFWYRGQLIDRAWKKIGQQLADEFKKMGDKWPGVSYEFHVRGIHRNKEHTDRRATVKYERYLIIYLPGDASNFHDYVEDKRSVASIVKGDSQATKERQDIIDDNPLTLPYWWATAKTKDGQQYFINNLKHRTQWNPPTMEQIDMEKAELMEVLAPPGNDDDEDYETDSEESS